MPSLNRAATEKVTVSLMMYVYNKNVKSDKKTECKTNNRRKRMELSEAMFLKRKIRI